jgi:hypothetical protein
VVGVAVPSWVAYRVVEGTATERAGQQEHSQRQFDDPVIAHLTGRPGMKRPGRLHGCLHLMLFGGNVSGSDLLRRDDDREGVGGESSRLQHRGSFGLVGFGMFER